MRETEIYYIHPELKMGDYPFRLRKGAAREHGGASGEREAQQKFWLHQSLDFYSIVDAWLRLVSMKCLLN